MLNQPTPTSDNLRDDLSAAFRLAERFGFHEGICNHFSVEVSGDPERYLINPYGVHWSQLTPDRLILIDAEGNTLDGTGEVETTAFFIHRAGHRANARHKCILHTHMPYATALTMLEDGRIAMAHQTAIRFYGRVAYDDAYGGLALDEDEGAAVAAQQGQDPAADVVFLAHHGVVVGGPTVAEAFDDLYYLERVCRQQVLAMSTGRPLKPIRQDVVAHTAAQYKTTRSQNAPQHLAALKAAFLG